MAAADFGEGFIQAPLIKQLQNILQQYPDDGQILKELIQNAEDAGATTVRFMYDKSSYGTKDGLYEPELCVHQGPALYAYNDAVFSEDDWKGIRMIQDSIKAEDPLKVGRFGLGFKSVFHMTDLPGILSGNQVGYLDPHESYFTKPQTTADPFTKKSRRRDIPTSSYAWPLNAELLHDYPNQFKPFMHNIFEVSPQTFKDGRYGGTLFRFPLRGKPGLSKISNIVYSEKKVQTLVDQIEKEAHFLMLFLKNIERIEFYERQSLKDIPQKKLSIGVSKKYATSVIKERKLFMETVRQKHQANEKSPIDTSYILGTDFEKFEKPRNRSSETKKWLVTHHYGVASTNEMATLVQETQNLPLVGVALPLQKENKKVPNGHVFCFLPMPLDEDNETGLGIHVNGYFAVDQNRRHLKWPSRDQSVQNSTDKQLKWNWFLQSQILPFAIVKLLKFAIKENCQNPDTVKKEFIYQIFPDKIKEHWKPVCTAFLEKLDEVKCLNTVQTQWLKPQKCYIIGNLQEASFKEVIRKVAVKTHLPLVEPPSNVMRCISNKAKFVSPRVIKDQLLKYDITLTTEERKLLVSYFVKEENIESLLRLKLLTLVDGSIKMFAMPSHANLVYLETSQCPKGLLPCSDSILVQCDPADDDYNTFRQIASSCTTQLQLLMPDNIPTLLKKIAGNIECYTSCSPPLYVESKWLDEIWKFMLTHHGSDLTRYEGLPIVPVTKNRWKTFTREIPYLAIKTAEQSLEDLGVKNTTLEKLGVTLVKEWQYAEGRYEPIELQKFIAKPSASGILDVLLKVQQQSKNLFSQMNQLEHVEKLTLIEVFCRQHVMLTISQTQLLKQLPLFICYATLENSTETWNSCDEIDCCSNFEYDIPLAIKVGKWDQCRDLAKLLSVDIKTSTNILLDKVFPQIQHFNTKQISNLMQQVLNDIDIHSRNNRSILNAIREVPFMSTNLRKYVKPCEIVDPSNLTIKKIFGLLDVFPIGQFATQKTLSILSSRNILKQISDYDVLALAAILDKNSTTYYDRAVEFFRYLSINDYNLSSCMRMKNLKWVPVKSNRPKNYPASLPWFGKPKMLVSPSEILSNVYQSLASSVKPMLADGLSFSLLNIFNCKSNPSIQHVINHLINMVKASEKENLNDVPMYMLMVKEVYKYLNDHEVHEVKAGLMLCSSWIWTGSKFTDPDHVVLQKPRIDTQPFVFHMPNEYQQCWRKESLRLFQIKDYIPETDILCMIKEYHKTNATTKVRRQKDLKICLSILHLIRDNKEKLQPNTPIPIRLLDSDRKLNLEEMKKCVYCDQETWKRQIDLDDVIDSSEGEEQLYEVHEDIPPPLAKAIGVPSLISRYIDAEPISYGQSEPLTRRIKTLLEDYTDGSSVLKELIQNADDAGAQQVSFIYDQRDFRQCSGLLLDEKMRNLQGPSILCHNDAEFSKDDFENIVKISGATKKEKTDKIGRFGLGFNAVYNLTDVPSFVSGNQIAIFDPQVKYLGDAVKDQNQPGIKLNLTNHGRKIRKLHSQFEPFQNIMECDLQQSIYYKGTLFRFPLRDSSSEISSKCYSVHEVQALFSIFRQTGESMLLFTQNVQRVNFFEIKEGIKMIEKGYISRTPVHLLKSITSNAPGDAKFNEEMKTLKIANKEKNSKQRNHIIIRTEVSLKPGELFQKKLLSKVHWSISNVVGAKMSISDVAGSSCMQQIKSNLLPVGSIAIKLDKTDQHYKPVPLSPTEGQIFCFLPLPIHYGLPFHINGYFAVTLNRRHLCEPALNDKEDFRAKWNVTLLEEVVAHAHISMLDDMVKHFTLFDECSLKKTIFDLFPVASFSTNQEQNGLVSHFIKAFYGKLVQQHFPVLPSLNKWVTFQNSKFLHPQLNKVFSKEFKDIRQHIKDKCCAFFQEDHNFGYVDMPSHILQLIKDDFKIHIETKLINLKHFYGTIFLPNVSQNRISVDDLLLYGILECREEIEEYLLKRQCIPVTSSRRFVKPQELVDPDCDLKDLYDPKEGPFPYWLLQNVTPQMKRLKPKIKYELQMLGMREKFLPYEEIIERAKTIETLQRQKVVQRSTCLLELLFQTMQKDAHIKRDEFKNLMASFKCIKILPVAMKPKQWYMKWYSDHHEVECLSVSEAYPESQRALTGCSAFISSFPHKSTHLQAALCYGKKHIEPDQIDIQLGSVLECINSRTVMNSQKRKFLQEIMSKIYWYLNNLTKESATMADEITRRYANDLVILVNCRTNGLRLVAPQICAEKENTDFSPYLYSIPQEFLCRGEYPYLFQSLRIKPYFNAEIYVFALKEISKQEKLVNGNHILTVLYNIALLLSNDIKHTGQYDQIVKSFGPIFLPDSKGIMTKSEELHYNNCQWYDSGEKRLLHPNIPYQLAKYLGVQAIREQMSNKHRMGIPFGQHEELTNRINRILEGYPCGKEILYELLQNADDAGASEINFIIDHRSHPTVKIFDKDWETLQGPALLVYNDKPFTEKDLAGIQKLGEGSKASDPLTTGKYGVGFNCVYHLTDTPTFLTASENDDDHSLVALDPQCLYVQGSSPMYPGQRWNQIDKVAEVFPDVFKCYDLPQMKTDGGTLFRFPLRTQTSVFSDKKVTVSDIKELFDSFSETLDDCLLFVNNICKVALLQINENGILKVLAEVKVNIHGQNLEQRQEFITAVKSDISNTSDISQIKFSQCSYEIDIESNIKKSKWVMVQQVGIENSLKLNENVKHGYKYEARHQSLLPIVGVAYCFDQKDKNIYPALRCTKRNIGELKSNSKLYCFLPLPIVTDYAMHMNGCFILDHESRRNLWKNSEMKGFKVEWNKLILEQIAGCYVSAMEKFSKKIPTNGLYSVLSKELKIFNKLFPKMNEADTYMYHLEKNIYECMVRRSPRILPVLQRTTFCCEPDQFPPACNVTLQWWSVGTNNKHMIFFNNLKTQFKETESTDMSKKIPIKQSEYIRNVLMNSCFPITFAQNFVLDKLLKISKKVSASYVNPKGVVNFFRKKVVDLKLPQPLQDTPFIDVIAFRWVFLYCIIDDFIDNPEGLPFLLSADRKLHVFHPNYKLLFSEYKHLIHKRQDLFADDIFLQYAKLGSMPTYLKEMKGQDLQTLLQHELEEAVFYGTDKTVCLDVNNTYLVNWLNLLWKFIDKCCDKQLHLFQNQFSDSEVQSMSKWCIMPVDAGPGRVELWPPCRSLEIVKEPVWDSTLIEIFKQLSLPKPYVLPGITIPNVLAQIVADFSQPYSILVALSKALERNSECFNTLEKNYKIKILQFFCNSLERMKEENNVRSLLKNLPFYQLKSYVMKSVNQCIGNLFTVPEEIPYARNWTQDNGNVYLQRRNSLDELYSFIGVLHLEVEDAYANHILHFFSLFTEEERHEHLKFLRLLFLRHELMKDDKSKLLLRALGNVPILTNNKGKLEQVSSFYDPAVKVFKLFENNFPNEPLNDVDWIEFFKKFGLVHKLNGDLILKYANSIAREANTDSGSKMSTDITEKCRIFCHEMYAKNEELLTEVAEELKTIKFLPVHDISVDATLLCAPLNKGLFVSFQGSTLSKHELLLWTQKPVLKEWAAPGNDDVCRELGIIANPSLLDVLQNTQKVCCNAVITNKKAYDAMILFITQAFTYIEDSDLDGELTMLQDMLCIPIVDGTELIKPTQISYNIPNNIATYLVPYLSDLPSDFSRFREFLKKVGATEKVIPEQYCCALKAIYTKSDGEEVDPNEEKAAFAAMKGLFKLQESETGLNSIETLYLLSSEKRMIPSNGVLYIDDLSLKERIKYLPLPCLYELANDEIIELKAQEIHAAILNLSKDIKPQLVSEILSEHINEECLSTRVTTDRCSELSQRLSSMEFANGLMRIIRYSERSGSYKQYDEDSDLSQVNKLKDVKFWELQSVTTFLKYQDSKLLESEKELPFYIKHDQNITVYLSSIKGKSRNNSFIRAMCEVVNKIVGNNKIDSVTKIFSLVKIFNCEIKDIASVLDEEGMPSFEATNMENSNRLAQPGEYVPVKFHHLLQPVAGLLRISEMVAYEVFDPFNLDRTDSDVEDIDSVYQYAEVLEKVSGDDTCYRNVFYKISLGDEDPIEVHASELYQFSRKTISKSGLLMETDNLCDDIPDSKPLERDLDEIKKDITQQLEAAWKMEERYKHNRIKQLWLQWHPDKNPECHDLATELFKFIQNEISRLEKGLEVSEVDGANATYSRQGYWNKFKRYYGRRAGNHKQYRDQFEEDHQSHSGSANQSSSSRHFTPPSYRFSRTKNPQPAEARRWMKQAEHDLDAVLNDMVGPCEWACFKCHQAAEKALKATQFAVDSGLKDNQHVLWRLCNAIDDNECKTLASNLETLLIGSAAMRYPDRHSHGYTPHDVFTEKKARQALPWAQEILKKCKLFIATK